MSLRKFHAWKTCNHTIIPCSPLVTRRLSSGTDCAARTASTQSLPAYGIVWVAHPMDSSAAGFPNESCKGALRSPATLGTRNKVEDQSNVLNSVRRLSQPCSRRKWFPIYRHCFLQPGFTVPPIPGWKQSCCVDDSVRFRSMWLWMSPLTEWQRGSSGPGSFAADQGGAGW